MEALLGVAGAPDAPAPRREEAACALLLAALAETAARGRRDTPAGALLVHGIAERFFARGPAPLGRAPATPYRSLAPPARPAPRAL